MKARRGLRTGKKNKRRAEHRRRDGRELETAETEREEIQKKQRAHRDTQREKVILREKRTQDWDGD